MSIDKKAMMHPGARPYADYIGKTIYGRGGKPKGIVTNVTMRICAVCGYAPCCLVKWEDGKFTKPCVKGIEKQADDSLIIE